MNLLTIFVITATIEVALYLAGQGHKALTQRARSARLNLDIT